MVLLTLLNAKAFGYQDFVEIQQRDILLMSHRPSLLFKKDGTIKDHIERLSIQNPRSTLAMLKSELGRSFRSKTHSYSPREQSDNSP